MRQKGHRDGDPIPYRGWMREAAGLLITHSNRSYTCCAPICWSLIFCLLFHPRRVGVNEIEYNLYVSRR